MLEDLPKTTIALGFPTSPLARFVPSLPMIVGTFAFAVAAVRGTPLLNDPDTYLHIAAGKWMLVHRILPTSDPFSHSLPGAHWVVHEWLSELLLGITYAQLGWHGLILLAALCFGLSLAMLTRSLLNHGEAMTSVLVAVASAILLEPHLLARPHLLALPVMVAWCSALIAARDARRAPPFALLPLMTLWSNLHGSFIVGVGLALFLAIDAVMEKPVRLRPEVKRWLWFTGFATAAALLNPNGISDFLLPIRFMGMPVFRDNIIEWLSPNFHQLQPLEIWILVLIFAGYSFALKLPPLRLLFLLILLHMSLEAVRHQDLLAILGPLLIWSALGPQLRARMEAGGTTFLAQGFSKFVQPAEWPAIVTTAIVMAIIAVGASTKPITPPDSAATPAAALVAAKAMNLSGPVFNDEVSGGYLIFNDVPVFIDGRMELYGDEFLGRYLRATRGDEATLVDILNQYHIGWTLLTPQSGASLIMKHLPGWERVYSDSFAVIDKRVSASGKSATEGNSIGEPRR